MTNWKVITSKSNKHPKCGYPMGQVLCRSQREAEAFVEASEYKDLIITDYESVNHPNHYQGNKFEVIDIIEDFKLNFNLGNALKYILRAGKKNDYKEDIKKAIWYLNRESTDSQDS